MKDEIKEKLAEALTEGWKWGKSKFSEDLLDNGSYSSWGTSDASSKATIISGQFQSTNITLKAEPTLGLCGTNLNGEHNFSFTMKDGLTEKDAKLFLDAIKNVKENRSNNER